MANMQKYKLNQASHVLGENLCTDGFKRDGAEGCRATDNVSLHACTDPRATLQRAIATHEETAGRKLRKDANVAFSWIVTLPLDVRPDDEMTFFRTVHDFLNRRYGGEANCLCSVVHVDVPGARVHLHEARMPVIDGKFQASKMVDRKDLQAFHADLSAEVERVLGYHVSVELSEQQRGEKALSKLGHEDYKRAKDELARLCKERDALRQEAEDLVAENNKLWEEVETARVGLRRILDGLARVLDCWTVPNSVDNYTEGVLRQLTELVEDVETWEEGREPVRAARTALTERTA